MLTRGRIEVLAEPPMGGHALGAPATVNEVRELARFTLHVLELLAEDQARIGALREALRESLKDTDLCDALLRDALRADDATEFARLGRERDWLTHYPGAQIRD